MFCDDNGTFGPVDAFHNELDGLQSGSIGNDGIYRQDPAFEYEAANDIQEDIMMLGSKGLLPPTDAYELLRCKAAPAILQTFEIR